MARRRKNTSYAQAAGVAIAAVVAIRILIAVVHAVSTTAGMAVLLLLTAGGGTGLFLKLKNDRFKRIEAQRAYHLQLQSIHSYMAMSPKEFEYAIAALCRRDGCTDVQVVGGAGDLAADVIATVPGGWRMVFQAKRYTPGNKVGSPDVQKVAGTYGIIHHAQRACVVTTSDFTAKARDFAARAGIVLLDQQALGAWASRTGAPPWIR